MHLVNGTGNSPSPGQPTPGVVKQDKSSRGSVDTTKTHSDPQRVRMSSGERPIAKGKQPHTEALCQPPTPPTSLLLGGRPHRSPAVCSPAALPFAFLSQQLIDNHYYAIANKASLTKPKDLSPPANKQEEFASLFGASWSDVLADNKVFNALDACAELGVDGNELDGIWAKAKKGGKLVKFGVGFYVGELDA